MAAATRANGPSPRPRGPHPATRPDRPHHRSIPMPVGTTGRSRSDQLVPFGPSPRPWGPQRREQASLWQSTVHPHARGDHIAARFSAGWSTGPSPRPWGPPVRDRRRHPHWRSIPTPVGTTTSATPESGTRPVHPHARGDHCRSDHSLMRGTGPSPRPWGPRRRSDRRRPCHRSIPTRVGTTATLVNARPYPGRSIPTRVGTTPTARRPELGAAVHPHARGDHDRPAIHVAD